MDLDRRNRDTNRDTLSIDVSDSFSSEDGRDPVGLGPDGFELSNPARPRYVLVGQVGEGAMGVVHVAQDLDLGRKVAFKTMLHDDALQHRRFLDEVQITAQLDHPNVVPVYSIERDEAGRPAYAMKLVRGRTLLQIVQDARAQARAGRRPDEDLRLAARLDHFLKVCNAVAYAHAKGVVHRDLKPDNVMVGRFGEVYVMDWGIAKVLGQLERPTDEPEQLPNDAGRRTRMGSIVGTPAYLSPEQANGELDRIGPLSDVYALGLLLYELVWLEQARRGTDVFAVMAKAAAGTVDPPEVGQIGERIPPSSRRSSRGRPRSTRARATRPSSGSRPTCGGCCAARRPRRCPTRSRASSGGGSRATRPPARSSCSSRCSGASRPSGGRATAGRSSSPRSG